MANKLPYIPDNVDDVLYMNTSKSGFFRIYCGYKEDYLIENLTELEKNFVICPVCSGIMRDAVVHSSIITCIGCSKSKKPNAIRKVRDSISKLRIRCPLLTDCDWKGVISEAERHLNVCSRYTIKCTLKCDETIKISEIVNHVENICPMRIVSCENCNSTGKAKNLPTHLEECPKGKVECPNECGEEITRESIESHNESCPDFAILCPFEDSLSFTDLECSECIHFREDLPEHNNESYITHINMLREQVAALGKRIDELALQVKCKKDLDGCEWHIEEPYSADEDRRFLQGPTFYVHGYKLKITASITKRSHSFKFRIVRIGGDYDDTLDKSRVTECRIMLINKGEPSKSGLIVYQLDYRLKIGVKSESFVYRKVSKTDNNPIFRFYFDIDSFPIKEALQESYKKLEIVSTTF